MASTSPWWNYESNLLIYHYYHKKEQFQVSIDQIDEWRAFAVTEGEFNYDIGGIQGVAGDGQFVLCPPKIPFGRITIHPITFHYFVFQWRNAALHLLPIEDYPKQVILSYRNQYRLFSSLSLLAASVQLTTQETMRWRNHLFQDLLLLYAAEQAEPLSSSPGKLDDPLMAKACTILEIHLDQPFHMQELANQIGLSPVQLSRRFRRVLGMNPSDYISKLRINKASQLLTHTTLSIEDISLQCGYNNGFYFSRVFSSKMNMSPSHYRKLYTV